MIRYHKDCIDSEVNFGAVGLGKGILYLKHILADSEEMNGAGRIFAHASLPAGAWVKPHEHLGESEIYYYLKGKGEYYDDGVSMHVGAGDVTKVIPGHKHGLRNIGNMPLEYICLVLYEKNRNSI